MVLYRYAAVGSDGSAAGGGYSDLSEWQGSVCNAAAPSARRTQGTPTGGIGRHKGLNPSEQNLLVIMKNKPLWWNR